MIEGRLQEHRRSTVWAT